MLLGVLITASVGILAVVFGWLIAKKEKLSLLHDYHYSKVPSKHKKAFCLLTGVGLMCIGFGLMVTAVLLACTSSLVSFLPFAAGFLTGISLCIYAGIRYNK